MSDIKYVKFTSERNLPFCTITKIEEDQGQPRVYKECYDSSGRNHLQNNIVTYETYRELMRNSRMDICSCTGDDILEIEYVKGMSLEQYLDELATQDNREGMLSLLKQYADEINAIHKRTAFEKTKEFIEVFGDVDIDPAWEATDFLNIDMIFSNIIIRDDRWVAIDYEWTFHFPIPLHFLLFRCVLYYCNVGGSRLDYINLDVLEDFGFSKREIQTYIYMERNFQAYVEGSYTPLRNKSCFLNPFPVTVYYDYGNGYSAENREVIMANKDAMGVIHLQFQIPERAHDVRIDPCEYPCMAKVMDCNSQWDSNGERLIGDTVLFFTRDPQFLFQKPDKKDVILDFILLTDIEGALIESIHNYKEKTNYEYYREKYEKEQLQFRLNMATRALVNKDNGR